MFRLMNTKGNCITKLDDWPRPKKKNQWKDGRSAKEFARFWTETHPCGTVPPSYQGLLEHGFPGNNFHGGQPESFTSLPPKGSKGPRMHDLHLWGIWPSGSLTVCVEAKTDESFEETISQCETTAKKDLKSNQRSRKRDRLEDLLDCVWRIRKPTESQSSLRYQLLHALVGTAIQALIDAERAGKSFSGTGVLLIHVFETDKTERKKIEQNQRDLERFACALPDVTIPTDGIVPGCLYGPAKVNVPGDFAPSGKTTPVYVYLARLLTVVH